MGYEFDFYNCYFFELFLYICVIFFLIYRFSSLSLKKSQIVRKFQFAFLLLFIFIVIIVIVSIKNPNLYFAIHFQPRISLTSPLSHFLVQNHNKRLIYIINHQLSIQFHFRSFLSVCYSFLQCFSRYFF